MKPVTIALLTDFGLDDPYVGVMKGVIASIAPQARLIDLTHQIPPGDIQRGAFVLWQAAQDFPSGTVFLGVVDPGVGTARKALYLQCGDQIFLGPDNGLFSYLLYKRQFTAWELTNQDYHRTTAISHTFHGRDVFAPAAAYAARGVSGDQYGDQLSSLHTLPTPKLVFQPCSISGEVISSDRFGNLFTSIGQFEVQKEGLSCYSWIKAESIKIPDPASLILNVHNLSLPFASTFGSVDRGDCAGLIGSTGLLEIIANQGSAKTKLGLNPGDAVNLAWNG